jgi:hydroxyethylthiazole kinase-like uncharacterized protein yjeF
LTPDEMAEADRRTIAAGVPGWLLMEHAGEAVATVARRMVRQKGRIAILAGPGNNGGDGLVAARVLAAGGFRVGVGLLVPRDQLKGDADLAAQAWNGGIRRIDRDLIDQADLIVDALFGAGLDRPLEGHAAEAVDMANQSGVPILSVDLPSGVDGRSGAVLGRAVAARASVTFFRRKPGHLLLPGRVLAGPVTVADIGIRSSSLEAIKPRTSHNAPMLWMSKLPLLKIDGNKYDRGHAVVVSGPPTTTGAARLAARAALRIGAGLVTVVSPSAAAAINAANLTAVMLRIVDGEEEFGALLADKRLNAVVLGPALGVGEPTRAMVATALASAAAVVVDADGLTSHEGEEAAQAFFAAIMARSAPVVLTPHDGEFARLFPDLATVPSKLERARRAAARSGAVVVLKGPDTVVATADGYAAIADNAPPTVATAGAGDVLAGFVGGLLAQGMPAFAASCAAVWIHGAAAAFIGRGLVAEDLADTTPQVFAELAAEPYAESRLFPLTDEVAMV